MCISAIAVANEFLRLSWEEELYITHLYLQKIVYLAHGMYIGLTGNPFVKEPFCAWKYGPVCQPMYDIFALFGSREITKPTYDWVLKVYQYEETKNNVIDKLNIPDKDKAFFKSFIKDIWNKFKGITATRLVSLTHQEGSPWYITKKKNHGFIGRNCIISNNDIAHYYSNLWKKIQTT